MHPGTIVDGKYEIAGQLGAGGMGTVYVAQNLATGRKVALKVMLERSKNADLVSRFRKEARAAALIESRNVAQVFDAGEDPVSGRPYIVMELLKGEDVAGALKRLGPLYPEVVARIGAQACVALMKAHEVGVIHRDLKPSNLFLANADDEIVVKVLDFGIAKVTPSHGADIRDIAKTRTRDVMGSPLYMSPEQARGPSNVDHRTDLWSLGMVMYEALAGMAAYERCESPSALFIALATEPPPALREEAPWVPEPLAAIVHRAITQDRELRFGSATEMLAALRALLPGGYALHAPMIVGVPPEITGERIARRLAEARTTGDRQAPTAASREETSIGITTDPRAASQRRAAVAAAAVVVACLATLVTVQRLRAHDDAVPRSVGATPASGVESVAAPVTSSPASSMSSAQPADASQVSSRATPPATGAALAPAPTAKTVRPPPATKPNCNPPAWTDSRGHVHLKEGCQ